MTNHIICKSNFESLYPIMTLKKYIMYMHPYVYKYLIMLIYFSISYHFLILSPPYIISISFTSPTVKKFCTVCRPPTDTYSLNSQRNHILIYSHLHIQIFPPPAPPPQPPPPHYKTTLIMHSSTQTLPSSQFSSLYFQNTNPIQKTRF